jgi:hypothetical protein
VEDRRERGRLIEDITIVHMIKLPMAAIVCTKYFGS